MKIISVSRRTDIPAFYGKWLMKRIHDGFAGYLNPFNGKKYIVSLKIEDVAAIALWSKNFSPFINDAFFLKDKGYSLFFNFTITGLPQIFEPGCPDEDETLASMKKISSQFSPEHINWRYDPVLVTDITDPEYHIEKFSFLCSHLTGYIKRCYISFPTLYGKVTKNFNYFKNNTSIKIHDLTIQEKTDLTEKLAVIAENSGIQIYSCCGDYLAQSRIIKGHCIDRDVLSSISNNDFSKFRHRPTRKECGCIESTDIGTYNICPHSCIYCYANTTYRNASTFYKNYVMNDDYIRSAFLGVTEKTSKEWLKEIRDNSDSEGAEPLEPENSIQQELF